MLGVEAGNGFIDHFCPTVESTRSVSPQEISDTYKQYVSTLSAGLLEVWCEEVVAPGLVDAVEGLSGAMVRAIGPIGTCMWLLDVPRAGCMLAHVCAAPLCCSEPCCQLCLQ
jgi:hypothetical protein